MKHIKLFEELNESEFFMETWEEHPKFNDAVDIVVDAMKNGDGGGLDWVSDLLGDEYPDYPPFLRTVMVNASKIINK